MVIENKSMTLQEILASNTPSWHLWFSVGEVKFLRRANNKIFIDPLYMQIERKDLDKAIEEISQMGFGDIKYIKTGSHMYKNMENGIFEKYDYMEETLHKLK